MVLGIAYTQLSLYVQTAEHSTLLFRIRYGNQNWEQDGWTSSLHTSINHVLFQDVKFEDLALVEQQWVMELALS